MHKFTIGVLALMLAVVMAAPASANAATSDVAAKLEALMKQIKVLQEQLAKIRGEVQSTIQEGLREGMSNDDVREIQELLASDSDLFPYGKATGYFGPMTKMGVMKFQQKAGLPVTGIVDHETHDLMEEMLKDRFGGKVPPGLLKAPGIYKKYMDRVRNHSHGDDCVAPFCKNDDDEDEDSDDDSDEDEDEDENEDEELEIDVEFEDGDAKIRIDYPNGTRKNLTLENETNEEDVIDYLVEYFEDEDKDFDEDDVRDAIEFDDSDWGKEVDTIEVTLGSTTAEVVVEYDDSDVDDKEFDLSETDRDEIVEDIADELGITEDAVRDLIEWKINVDSDVEEITVEIDGGDAEVRIEFENGFVMEFEYTDEEDEDEIIKLLADELDMDEDDVEDLVDFE